MTPRPPSPDRETIEAMAAAWLAQRDEGLSPDEAAEFQRWQSADPRHAAAVERLELTWGALQQLREFRPQARAHPDRDLLARPVVTARYWPAWAVAAAVVLVAALGLWTGGALRRSPGPEPQVFATTAGGYQRIALEDGSLLELNASSVVALQFSPKERRLWLRRGEAHFTVAKDAARPFFVVAGGVSVRAVGTEFNVRLSADGVEVLVTEGQVKVEPAAASPPRAAAAPPLLEAGDLAHIAAEAGRAEPITVRRVTPAAMREVLAWQGPRLMFVDTPLAEVVEQFNRRNQLRIELGDPDLATLPVGGSFRAENVEAFLRLLTSDGELVIERPAPDRVIVRRRH